jgi:hypothetical protein
MENMFVAVQLHAFLISVVDGAKLWASSPSRFNPQGMRQRYLLDRSRVGSRTYPDAAVEGKITFPYPESNSDHSIVQFVA